MLEWISSNPTTAACIVYVCCVVGMLLMALSICRGGSFYDDE
jgi:hypothetical protein